MRNDCGSNASSSSPSPKHSPGHSASADRPGQVDPWDVLHDQRPILPDAAEVFHADDGAVLNQTEDPRLISKAEERVGGRVGGHRQHLQRDLPGKTLESADFGQIDDAKASFSKSSQYAVPGGVVFHGRQRSTPLADPLHAGNVSRPRRARWMGGAATGAIEVAGAA